LRFSTPSALAGHARVFLSKMSGGAILLDDYRFDVRVTPARAFSSRTCRSTFAPAGFRFCNGHVAMKLVWRACGPGVGPNPSLVLLPAPAGASTRCRDFFFRGTLRRLDGLLPVAPYVCDHRPSGATGETGFIRTRAGGPTTRAPSLPVRPVV